MLHHFNHSWLTAQLEQAQEWEMEGREGWSEVDVMQADGEILAKFKEPNGGGGGVRYRIQDLFSYLHLCSELLKPHTSAHISHKI